MEQERNRVIDGMQEWKAKEQSIADLFSPSAIRTRYVRQLRLDHLYELRNKLGTNATKDERIMLRILKGEIRAMEKRLYPSPIIRYAVKLGRELKHIFQSSAKQESGLEIKIPRPHIDEFGHQNRATVKVQQKAALRPTLVQKKRVSQKKGLRIK